MKKIAYLLVAVGLFCFNQAFADNLSPTDDAYTSSLTKNMNYGDNSWLDVGTTSGLMGTTYYYQGYLKFNLSDYSTGVGSAYLYLYQPLGVTSDSISAYSTSNLWNEGTIKWNNQPSVSGTPVTVTVGSGVGNWYCWDVSSLAQSAAGDNFSLALLSSGKLHAFYSSESLVYKPYLSVTGTVVPEPVSTILFITGGTVLLARRLRKGRK